MVGRTFTTTLTYGISASTARPQKPWFEVASVLYFDYFWNDFAADKTHSIPEADREAYTAAYSRPGRMHAGWAYFVSFQQAAKDFARLSQTKLTMPVLTIGGDKSQGETLGNKPSSLPQTSPSSC